MTETAKSAASAPPGRRFRGLSAAQRKARRREQLVEAGLEAFGRRGFHNVGVRDVCAEARLTERYFYESFRNREALFMAVYEESIQRVYRAVAPAFADPTLSPADLARASLRSYLEGLRDDPRIARILLIDALTVSADVGDQSRLAVKSFLDLTQAAIDARYPDLGKLSVDSHLVSAGLVGSTMSIAMQWAFNGFQEPLEDVLNQCALFYDSLALAIAQETEAASPDGGKEERK